MRVGSEHEGGGDMGCEWAVNMRGVGIWVRVGSEHEGGGDMGCEWTVNMKGVGIWGASRQ